MDAKQREALLFRWEATVRCWPDKARVIGPPSWLVQEEWKGRDKDGKDKEAFADAAIRVRKRYGLPESPQAQ